MEVDEPGDTMAFPQWLEPIVEHDVTDEDEYSNQTSPMMGQRPLATQPPGGWK